MRRLVICALGALLLLACVTGCAGLGLQGDKKPAKGKGRSAAPAQPARPPVVFMLGDSYTAGITGVSPEQTYAGETARRLGWQAVIGGLAGTGYIQRSKSGKNFPRLLDIQLAWRPVPDMVIVSGGHNDRHFRPGAVAAAADRLLLRVRSLWPRARLVVIGPMWGGDAPSDMLAIRDALRGVAAALAIPFIDPLQERWITGSRRHSIGNAQKFILRDETHPTAAGNRYIAERLIADLKALGLARPVQR